MNEMNLFKISYDWYEGEHSETLLAKNVSSDVFETDLLQAKVFAESLLGNEIEGGNYLGKGYAVECLPEYYEQITWFLKEKKGYAVCSVDEQVEYLVDDGDNGSKIVVNKKIKKTEWQELEAPKDRR